LDQDKLFSLESILLVPCGILMNLIGAQIALAYQLPIFLDSVGTIFVGALGGILPGITVGFFSNAIDSIGDPITLYYGIVSILFGFVSAQLSRRRVFVHFGKTLAAALFFALIGGGFGSLLTWMLSGLDLGSGISAPYALKLHDFLGFGKFAAQLTADLGVDILDKLVSLPIVWCLLRFMPEHLLRCLPYGNIYLNAYHSLSPSSTDTADENKKDDYGN
jgi:hypothetical protein